MEHVNGWCFRGIYKGGLWEDDLRLCPEVVLEQVGYQLLLNRTVINISYQ